MKCLNVKCQIGRGQSIEKPPDRDRPGGNIQLVGEDQSDGDADSLTVECNNTALRSHVAGEKFVTLHGLSNIMM